MKSINSTIIEKLNKIENFCLCYDNGGKILWNINAPGLHVLQVAYQFIKFAGEPGQWSLFYHGHTGDFFKKLFEVLNKSGLTEDFAPEKWGYIKKLNKYADSNSSPAIKANTNVQLFVYIQDFLENVLYNEYVSRTRKRISEDQDIFKELLVAADSFILRSGDGYIHILAGYPWFDQSWGRDTFISLPGILLVTERYEYAKSIFSFYAKLQAKDGLIPKVIYGEEQKEYNSADSSLWFIEALNRYQLAERSHESDDFVKKMLPTVNRIIECYTKPQGDIFLDQDKLVVVPPGWTWMDASLNNKPFTPRNGKPVEIQALFYNALGVASKFNLMSGNNKVSQKYDALRKTVKEAINNRFFADNRWYPFDVVDGDPCGGDIRPNAVFMVSLSSVSGLLSTERKESIIDTIEKELLTPYGLRTLSPNDPKYVGHYETFVPSEVKDPGYHQGTVWPFLMSHYIFAKINAMGEKRNEEIMNELRNKIEPLMKIVRDNETVPEIFSGDSPYWQGGAVSQAWSVGALLEMFYIFKCGTHKIFFSDPWDQNKD